MQVVKLSVYGIEDVQQFFKRDVKMRYSFRTTEKEKWQEDAKTLPYKYPMKHLIGELLWDIFERKLTAH